MIRDPLGNNPTNIPERGRLAQTFEGAGKRPIFAIGNYLRQRLLFPVHPWAMDLLRSIPMDGTFKQMGPITRLIPH